MRNKSQDPFIYVFAILLIFSLVNVTYTAINNMQAKEIETLTADVQEVKNELNKVGNELSKSERIINDANFEEILSDTESVQESIDEINEDIQVLDQKIEEAKERPYLTRDASDEEIVLYFYNLGREDKISSIENSDLKLEVVDSQMGMFRVNHNEKKYSYDLFIMGELALEIGEFDQYYSGTTMIDISNNNTNWINLKDLKKIGTEEENDD